jgi:sortase (surface protein transpeptidase)
MEYCPAGHREHSYGRLLNRMNEVKVDDIIVISTNVSDFKYKIINVLIAKSEAINTVYCDL